MSMEEIEELRLRLQNLEMRVFELEGAIQYHREQTANAVSWENDTELWSHVSRTEYKDTILDLKANSPHLELAQTGTI